MNTIRNFTLALFLASTGMSFYALSNMSYYIEFPRINLRVNRVEFADASIAVTVGLGVLVSVIIVWEMITTPPKQRL